MLMTINENKSKSSISSFFLILTVKAKIHKLCERHIFY